MSLILEALRKSEAERRRGQSPDLFAPAASTPAAVGRPRTWPLLLLGAMLLGSAWLIWDSGERAAPTQDRAEAEGVATPSATDEDRASVEAADPRPAPRNAPRASAPAAAPPAQVPAASAAASLPPASTPAPSAPARGPAAEPAAPPVAAVMPPPPSAAQTPEPPPAGEEALPPVAVLDAATRAALPALKLSMHVYADDPARRFAIVDGQRVGEGAVLGTGRVAQIRRDGVVIEVNGRRVLLPKP